MEVPPSPHRCGSGPANTATACQPSPLRSPSFRPLGSPLRPKNSLSLNLTSPTPNKATFLSPRRQFFFSPQSILSPPTMAPTPGSPYDRARLWQQQMSPTLKSPTHLASPQAIASRFNGSPKTPKDQMITTKCSLSIKAPRRPNIIAKRRHRILSAPPELEWREPETRHEARSAELIRPQARRPTVTLMAAPNTESTRRISPRAADIVAVLSDPFGLCD